MKIVNKFLFIFFLNLIIFKYFFFYYFSIVFKFQKNTIIEVDVSYCEKRKIGGPAAFVRGIKEVLPYKTSNCLFFASKDAYSEKKINKYDFLYVPKSRFNESYFKKWAEIRESNIKFL